MAIASPWLKTALSAALLALAAGMWLLLQGGPTSAIRRDEVVVFFPSYAVLSADGSAWRATVHGKVCEPEEDGVARAALLSLLRRALGLEPGDPGVRALRRARPELPR